MLITARYLFPLWCKFFPTI